MAEKQEKRNQERLKRREEREREEREKLRRYGVDRRLYILACVGYGTLCFKDITMQSIVHKVC